MMKWYVEDKLYNFKFWSGAENLAATLTNSQFNEIEQYIEDAGREWSDTDINDFFWHDKDLIAEILGYRDADALLTNDDRNWIDYYYDELKEKYSNINEDAIYNFVYDELYDEYNSDVFKQFEEWYEEYREDYEEEE